jgi:uncharacterized membrane protein
MSDPNQGGLPPPQPSPGTSDILSNIPQLVYLLFFAGFVVAPAALVGVVLAYVNRDGANALARSHYDFQIATFWRGLVLLAVGVVTAFFLIGWLVLLFWLIWTVIRLVKGFTNLSKNQPMVGTIGWGFG